jgi:hypothetical protein
MSMIQLSPPPLSHTAMADLLCTIMILVRGEYNGKPAWAYMCIKPSMARAFSEARAKGAFDIEEFGSVIESGDGHEPPADVKQRMEREYAMNHRFEDDLLAAAAARKLPHEY